MEGYLEPRVVSNLSNINRNYLVWGNVVFFIPLFCFGATIPSVLTACIGILSMLFHSTQCNCCKKEGCDHVKHYMFADMFGVSVLAVVVIAMFWKYIPLFWWLLWLGPLWLYFKADHHVSEEDYAWMHGTWHVAVGVLLTSLFVIRHKIRH